MRLKKLNLNSSSSAWVTAIGILICAVPLLAYTLSQVFRWLYPPWTAGALWLVRASLFLGVDLFVVFGVLVIVELVQDYFMDCRYHREVIRRKVRLETGFFECQYCGNVRLREGEAYCPVCGRASQL